jgi:hypothetical protein
MIRPIRPISMLLPHVTHPGLTRSDASNGALSRQQGAIRRRRNLQAQQEQLEAGRVDYRVRPPYPYRPRPPG